jgi:hypothetical protein
MKKNQVPRPRATAATIQPTQTNARTARSLLRSEGMPIPDCLPGERMTSLLDPCGGRDQRVLLLLCPSSV